MKNIKKTVGNWCFIKTKNDIVIKLLMHWFNQGTFCNCRGQNAAEVARR
jgi:hypothetical protein